MKPEDFWKDFSDSIREKATKAEAQEKMPEMLQVIALEKKAFDFIIEAANGYLTANAFPDGLPDPETTSMDDIKATSLRFTNHSAAMVRALLRTAARLMAEVKCSGDDAIDDCNRMTNTLMHAMQDAIFPIVTKGLPESKDAIRELMKELTDALQDQKDDDTPPRTNRLQ